MSMRAASAASSRSAASAVSNPSTTTAASRGSAAGAMSSWSVAGTSLDLFAEQLGMRAGPHKADGIALDLVNQ
jgi:hypothetical protein